MNDMILWPQPDGTSRTIEADAIRALVGHIEQRDEPDRDDDDWNTGRGNGENTR